MIKSSVIDGWVLLNKGSHQKLLKKLFLFTKKVAVIEDSLCSMGFLNLWSKTGFHVSLDD